MGVHATLDEAIKALARCLLPVMRSYFESVEGWREFAEWQEQSCPLFFCSAGGFEM